MSDKYILVGMTPVKCDLLTWAAWFENSEHRRVAHEERNGVRVSTMFLGIDHQWGEGPPLLYETMIFGGAHDQYQERCSTWEQAEAMHATACAIAYANGADR